MRLCTFEIVTHRGRDRRVGAVKDGRVIDLNSALAWYMDQQQEPEPQRLADALVPSTMPEFLRAGLRAAHSAEELFLGAGPHPADWWRMDPPPRGPNQETLVYPADTVRLCAPGGALTPNERVIGPEDSAPAVSCCQVSLAAVCGRRRTDLSVRGPLQNLAGFTLGARFDSSVAMGPVLATLDEILDPYRLELTVRIDGKEHCRLGCAGLSRSLEEKLEELERDRLLRPGIVIALPVGSVPVSSGETIEIEAGPIGTLRNRVA